MVQEQRMGHERTYMRSAIEFILKDYFSTGLSTPN